MMILSYNVVSASLLLHTRQSYLRIWMRSLLHIMVNKSYRYLIKMIIYLAIICQHRLKFTAVHDVEHCSHISVKNMKIVVDLSAKKSSDIFRQLRLLSTLYQTHDHYWQWTHQITQHQYTGAREQAVRSRIWISVWCTKRNWRKKKAKIEKMIKDTMSVVWNSVDNHETLSVYNLLTPLFMWK